MSSFYVKIERGMIVIQQVGMNQGGFWETDPKRKFGSNNFAEVFQAERAMGNTAALDTAENSQTTDSTSVWDRLSQQYDIHNATFNDLKAIASQLYQAGQIDLLHLGILTFDLTPLYRKLGYPPEIQFLIPSDQFGRRDWIAEWEARAEQQLKLGNTLGYQRDRECLEILRRLE